METKQTVLTQCDECGGTGLYQGMCEGPGIAVVCVRCDGTGCRKISYIPFTARKERRGVKVVKRSAGTFIVTGVGPRGDGITYAEFKQGKMP
jgi:hypothetical protein